MRVVKAVAGFVCLAPQGDVIAVGIRILDDIPRFFEPIPTLSVHRHANESRPDCKFVDDVIAVYPWQVCNLNEAFIECFSELGVEYPKLFVHLA